MKAYFLIVNVVMAVVAFSWMVSGAETYVGTETGAQYLIEEGKVYSRTSISNDWTLTKVDPSTLDSSLYVKTDLGKGLKIPPVTGAKPTGTTKLSKLLDTGIGTSADAIVSGAQYAAIAYLIVKMGSGMFGASKATGDALSAAAAVGFGTYKLLSTAALAKPGVAGVANTNWIATTFGKEGAIGKLFGKYNPITRPGLWGVGLAVVVFVLMYKKTDTEIVEFDCEPWQPPIGGNDCQLCNEVENGCSEYRCKSLGQACELLNSGTEEEKCTWVNPHDVNSPKIRMIEVSEGYIYKPDTNVRPPATGVYISQENGNDVEAFFPLEFTIETDEPSQCKIDYNLTVGFEEMSYYFGGDSLFDYNHTEEMSLPGPDAINAIAPELKNDGTYTLYVRCQDANGNFNQDAYSVRFKVESGPDTTAPRILDLEIPSNMPISYNETELGLEVYVNEPAECKWSREDRSFENMENSMSCATNMWEMNNRNVYTCTVTLTGIESRKNNDYYFRCKDQPGALEGDRNVNTQSYLYTIIGTQPLNILEVAPNETIRGSTDTIPVFLEIKTDNGYLDGQAFCYYYNDKDNSAPANDEDYIMFAETDSDMHKQRQDLNTSSYIYYYKCVDLGGNAAYDLTTFNVEVDRQGPNVVRVYREGDLKIITNEDSICTYSTTDCNFNIGDGISMPYDNEEVHTADWKVNQKYYIRCKDEYDNQPNPNTCSIVVNPYSVGENVVEL